MARSQKPIETSRQIPAADWNLRQALEEMINEQTKMCWTASASSRPDSEIRSESRFHKDLEKSLAEKLMKRKVELKNTINPTVMGPSS